MKRSEIEHSWHTTLRTTNPSVEQFDFLAQCVFDQYESGDTQFRQHIANRFNRVAERSGHTLDPARFDLETARAFIADEIGFEGWDRLISFVNDRSEGVRPILFQYAVAAMERGDFSALESMVGGSGRFGDQIKEWYERGYFIDETDTLAEVFSAACMLGYDKTAAFLLDKGVDPYAGMKTGLAGFHYAASSGRLNVIKLLIERKVPMEVENMYGGTVFGQAIWSTINEYTPDHAAIVEALVEAGAVVEPGYLEWWQEQSVPDAETKERVTDVLRRYTEFHARIDVAKEQVAEAEAKGNRRMLADALKALGNILRRPPFLREAAIAAYTRAGDLYSELGLQLEEAWVKRHIGINHEYAERLADAERFYDDSLPFTVQMQRKTPWTMRTPSDIQQW